MNSEFQAVIDRLSSRIDDELNILDARLSSAWQVLSARTNASELTVNSQGTRLDVWFAPGALSHWGGSAKATLIGTGLSTDTKDNNYSVSSVTLGLFEAGTLAASGAKPLAQLTAQMSWVVEPDVNGFARTKSFSLQNLLVESGELGLFARGPMTLNVATNSVVTSDSLIEIRLGKDANGTPALKAQFEGGFSLNLDSGALSGTLTRLGLYDAQNQPVSVRELSLSFNGLAALDQEIQNTLIEPLRGFFDTDLPDIATALESYFQAVSSDLQLPNPSAARKAKADGTEVEITYPQGAFGYTDGRVFALIEGSGLSVSPDDSNFDISRVKIRFEPSNLLEPNILPELEFSMRADVSVRPETTGEPNLTKFLLYELSAQVEGLGISLKANAGIDYLDTSPRQVAGSMELRSGIGLPAGTFDKILVEGTFDISQGFDTIAGIASRVSLIDQAGSTQYQLEVDQTFTSVGDLFSPAEVEKWLSGYLDTLLPERAGLSTGRAYFWKGGYLMPEVTIVLPGEAIVQTSANGSYALSDLSKGSHRVEASKQISKLEQGDVISSADALAALKLAVGRNPNIDGLALSPYQLIAADVNNDGRVTSADALAILKMAVKRADAPARQWAFVDERLDLWDEANARFHADRQSVPIAENVSLRFDPLTRTDVAMVGILKGDVNGSWQPGQPELALPTSYFNNLVTAIPSLAHPHQFGMTIA